MQSANKLAQIVKSIRLSQSLWQEKIHQSWNLGQNNGQGFAIGDPDDSLKEALAKEGFDFIIEINEIAIGTDWINTIVAVKKCYGPWAVDITDNLLKSNYSMPRKMSIFNRLIN